MAGRVVESTLTLIPANSCDVHRCSQRLPLHLCYPAASLHRQKGRQHCFDYHTYPTCINTHMPTTGNVNRFEWSHPRRVGVSAWPRAGLGAPASRPGRNPSRPSPSAQAGARLTGRGVSELGGGLAAHAAMCVMHALSCVRVHAAMQVLLLAFFGAGVVCSRKVL